MQNIETSADTDDFDLENLDVENMIANATLDDPLAAVPVTGDIVADSKADLSAMLAAFKGREKAEKDRKRAALDSEYWFCVCFQSREQKDAFLKAVEWFEHGDKYLDGKFVAQKMGVTIPDVANKFPTEKESTLCRVLEKI